MRAVATCLALTLASGCAIQNAIRWASAETIEGVPVRESRPFLPEEREAIARVIRAVPTAPWWRVRILLMRERPESERTEAGKVGGYATPFPYTFDDRDIAVAIGPRDPACVLVHEMAEHVGPYHEGRGWNRDHSRPELTDLSMLWQLESECDIVRQ